MISTSDPEGDIEATSPITAAPDAYVLESVLNMGNRIVAVGLIGLSMALLTSCASVRDTFIERPGGYPGVQAARDKELASEEYERKKQEKHEGRVDELSRAYEEFLKSQGTIVPPAEESEQSIVKINDDTDNL